MTDAKDRPLAPVRAKAGYIEVERRDKTGRVRPAKQHLVASEGMHTAREMEQIMRGIAAEVGADESQIRIDTYKQGRSPLEVNPRHREKEHVPRVVQKRGVTPQPRPHSEVHQPRTFFAGGAPRTPEEWAAHVAAFEARRVARESS